MDRITNITKKEELVRLLISGTAMVWEGMNEKDFAEALDICGTKDSKGYVVKGATMNRFFKLAGEYAYPDDINIFCIDKAQGLAIKYGATWLDTLISSYPQINDGPSNPYIINVGSEVDELLPYEAAATKEEAIDAAEKLLIFYDYTEVVYMPEDNDDINDVVWRSWDN